MSAKNPPVPAHFEDQLDALLVRIKAEGWDKRFSIDAKSMDAGLKEHRAAKQKDAELRQAFEQHHKALLDDQVVLYRQYVEALGVLRAAHRSQPEVLRSLDGFKRKSSGSRKKKAPLTPPQEPARPSVTQ